MASTKGTSLHRNKSYDVKIVEISQMVAEISQFFNFFKMAAVHHPEFVESYLDHPQRVIGVLYRGTKFCWNRQSSFDNTQVSYFTSLAWKCLFTPPKWWFWGNLTPKFEMVTMGSTKGTSSELARCLSEHALLTLIHALVVSKVDYCCSVLAGVSGSVKNFCRALDVVRTPRSTTYDVDRE